MKEIRLWKIFLIIALLLIGMGSTLVMDTWTVPAQNNVAISQLNGGGNEFIMMQTTNSFLTLVRSWIMPVFFIIIILIAVHEGFRVNRVIKTKQEKEEKK